MHVYAGLEELLGSGILPGALVCYVICASTWFCRQITLNIDIISIEKVSKFGFINNQLYCSFKRLRNMNSAVCPPNSTH